MKTPHKHAELIKAWADGAEIEQNVFGMWATAYCPQWDPEVKYRIKPEPKPDVEYKLRVFQHSMNIPNVQDYIPHFCWPTDVSPATLKLIFDGETGKLKSAEVL